MQQVMNIIQFAITIIIGIYFFSQLKGTGSVRSAVAEDSKRESENINRMRHVRLSVPLTEKTRPHDLSEIIGQENGIKALRACMCGRNPQHILIYGPPGVGKTAAARLMLEEAKRSEGTPFKPDARFVEADATTMRYDERSIADPLIGSVHDPIYQGAGAYGNAGIPQPKPGAVSKAHGGVLFIDEIGELNTVQMNKLLKVLEDRCVYFESAYYSEHNKNIPLYIHDIFQNGMPADFRLIGATTRKPEEIPEAVRSRCMEIYFNPLTYKDILTIVKNAAKSLDIEIEENCLEMIAAYSKNGRDGVRILELIAGVCEMNRRHEASADDVKWVIETGHYKVNRA